MTTTDIKKNSTKSFASRTKDRGKHFEFTAPEYTQARLLFSVLNRPTMLREIDWIAVGIMNPVFGLTVWRSFVYVGRGVEFFACVSQASDILHFEAEMVQSGLQLRAFDLALRLDGYDG